MLIDQEKISRSTFYKHYPNKEFLVQTALSEFIDEQSVVMNDLIKNGMNKNEILLMTLDVLNRYKKQYRAYEKIDYSLVKDRPWNLLIETAIARINQVNTKSIYVVIFLHRGSFVYCLFFLVRFTGSVQWGFLFRDRSRSCLPPKGHCSEEVFSCQKDRDSARGVPFFFSVAKTLTRLISPLLLETWNVPW